MPGDAGSGSALRFSFYAHFEPVSYSVLSAGEHACAETSTAKAQTVPRTHSSLSAPMPAQRLESIWPTLQRHAAVVGNRTPRRAQRRRCVLVPGTGAAINGPIFPHDAVDVTLDNRSRLGSLLQEFPESSASAFAFQAGAGVGFDIGAGVTISLGYRLYGTTEAELPWNAVDTGKDEVLKASVLHHNVDLGIGFRF